MSRSLSRWQALFLGLVVLVGLALGMVGLFAVGSRGWFGSNPLHVRVGFPEIRGVELGTRVRIQGIDAGEVVGISPPIDPDAPVELRLRIRSDCRHLVRTASSVQIVSEGMLGAKVIEIRPPRTRLPDGQPAPAEGLKSAAEDTLLAAEPSTELNDVLDRVGSALSGLEKGEGTIGKLFKDPAAYEALVTLLRSGNDAAEKGKETLTSIQRDADALKKMPIIRNYVEDPVALLVRPRAERNRRTFAESELFEPGRAVLTANGRAKLDDLAPWLLGLKHKGSDVVVVSYADPKTADGKLAPSVTRQQSEAVVNYLRNNHKIHKMSWFTSRKVSALGLGTASPPQPESDPLPTSRVEVIVFVPHS